jgi:hypothetical protein
MTKENNYTCGHCGSEAVPMYSLDDKRVSKTPIFCKRCEALTLGSSTILPGVEPSPVALKDMATAIAVRAAVEIQSEPEARIQKYFERVFNWAFSEGFLRAYSYLRHNQKEGRLARMRAIINSGTVSHCTFEAASPLEMEELVRLARWKRK